MSPIATYPLSRVTTGTIDPDGVDLVVVSAGVDLPEAGLNSYEMALHEDGALCPAECGCVGVEARTTIWDGTAIARGEWMWHAGRYVLIGVRSTGPTKPELRERIAKQGERVAELEGRVEYLEECWADEREGHHLAKVQMNDDARLIDRLKLELGESAEALEVLRAAREKAAAARDRAEAWVLRLALGGCAAAVVLAVVLVWAVIA